MTTPTTPAPAAPPSVDAVFTGLQANVYKVVGESAAVVGCAPTTVSTGRDATGSRHASMVFDTVDEAVAWAAWLHWAYAFNARDGKYLMQAYGRWLGFSWHIMASEPLPSRPEG